MKFCITSLFILILSTQAFGASGRKKINTKDLQEKYWTSKDYKTGVVQSRAFAKSGRLKLGIEYMNLLNDKYSVTDGFENYRAEASYYANERIGVGAFYEGLNLQNNTAIEEMLKFNNGQFTLDHVKASSFYGASLEFVPIYSKMSWMNNKIIYFDLSISPKIGMVTYNHQLNNQPNTEETNFAGGLDIAANIFLNNNFSLNVAYRVRGFQADVLAFESGALVEEGKLQTLNFLTLGLNTYF